MEFPQKSESLIPFALNWFGVVQISGEFRPLDATSVTLDRQRAASALATA